MTDLSTVEFLLRIVLILLALIVVLLFAIFVRVKPRSPYAKGGTVRPVSIRDGAIH